MPFPLMDGQVRQLHPLAIGTPIFPARPRYGAGSLRVKLENQLIKLLDLSPLLRNDNSVGSVLEQGVGPHGIWKADNGTWQMITEVYSSIGGVTNNGQTGAMRASAPTLQGPWTLSPSASLVITPAGISTWEYLEYSPHQPIWDSANNRWFMTAHGGNNQGPRQIGFTYSTDGKLGQSWTKDPSNPILTPGASGAIDDNWLADLRLIQNSWTGRWIGLYRAQKVGGPSDGTVARVEGPTFNNLTKTGGVITTAPAWATNGYHVGDIWYDAGGRLHHFGASGALGIGYSFSDDDGQTWIWGNGANAVLTKGASGTSDKDSAGGTLRLVDDGDILFITYHASNLSDYPTNPPLRAPSAAITPARCVSPIRQGKFHLSGSRTIVDTAAKNAIVSPLNTTIFSMCGRFRAYRTARVSFRRLWSETTNPTNSSIQFFISLAANGETGGGATNAGKFHLFFRTPGGIVEFLSAVPLDDTFWHKWLLRRIGLASFELYIDGSLVGTSSVSATLNSSAMEKCIGNNPVVNGQDHPTNMTQSNIHFVSGYAMTVAEANALMDSGAPPSSGTLTINWPMNPYTESGDVATVESFVQTRKPTGYAMLMAA
jgi:hypothetical protein